MSIIVEKNYITLVLNRINNFNQDHQQGWSNIPHLCIKVKHGNGFAWFGVNIVKYDNVFWNRTMRSEIIEEITKGIDSLTDLDEIVSDMDRIVDSILEVVNERKTRLLLSDVSKANSDLDDYILRNSNFEEKNTLISLNLSNSVILEVYDEMIDFDSMSYGGFALEVTTNKGKFPAALFHKSIVINNYIDSDLAEVVTKHALESYLKGIVDVDIGVEVIQIAERNRNRSGK